MLYNILFTMFVSSGLLLQFYYFNIIYMPYCLLVLLFAIHISSFSILSLALAYFNLKQNPFLYKVVQILNAVILIIGILLIIIAFILLGCDIWEWYLHMHNSEPIQPKDSIGSGFNEPSDSDPNKPKGPNNTGPSHEVHDTKPRKKTKIVDMHPSDSGEDNDDLDSSYAINPLEGQIYRDIYNKFDPDSLGRPMKDLHHISKVEHDYLYAAFKDSIQENMSREEYLNCRASIIAKTLAARRAHPFK